MTAGFMRTGSNGLAVRLLQPDSHPFHAGAALQEAVSTAAACTRHEDGGVQEPT